MDISEIIITLIFTLGIGYILFLIIRDPLLMIKSLLRGLKADTNFKLQVVLFAIWGTIWIIDKIYGLKLYIKELEEASIAQNISFGEFEKYVLIDTLDIDYIDGIIKSFQQESESDSCGLKSYVLRIAEYGKNVAIEIENKIDFQCFNSMIQYLDNAAPKNQIYHVKGILINRNNRKESYFVFSDMAYSVKLIGKTYKNKRMYIDLDPDNGKNELIYLNSNIEYFKNFDFDNFDITKSSIEPKPITKDKD